ncbi:amidohydrolase [Brevibacillus sp. B_LB10_24]|uniref:amidohydrolase n=1 Tax=Brevibacillus sp. B_LB10_24 TaxID=3380645 RepID=UPI0038B6CE9D
MDRELVLINGRIVSMDAESREYEAVAMQHGRIVSLGPAREVLRAAGPAAEVVDLNGRTVLPGFIDAHQHMIYFGHHLSCVDCRRESIADMAEAIRARAKELEPTDWIIGQGFDETCFREKRLPTAEDLRGIPNPVYITRFCLHAAVVNQAGLAAAGIDETTSDPPGGELMRDEQGKLTGVLREKALDLIRHVLPPCTPDDMRKALTLADRRYISEGITTVHEAGIGFFTDSFEEFAVFQEMTRSEAIHVRVYGMVLDKFFPLVKAARMRFGLGDGRFKLGPVKIFSDGTLSGRTAAVSEEYLDPPGTTGMMVISADELQQKVLEAHLEGYQVSVHAIGDRAIDQVIAAYENALAICPREDHRHRIEHCAVTAPELIRRIKKLGLIPVPQTALLHTAGDVYRRVLKPHVLQGLYPYQTFFQEGVRVAGSSDCPVVPSSPLLGLYTAMTRQTTEGAAVVPEQQISLFQALQMYTVHAAYASFGEREIGTIELGKYGDLVVLPEGFMSFSPDEVKEAKVELTVIDGKIVFSR